jgi:hypothetical protein
MIPLSIMPFLQEIEYRHHLFSLILRSFELAGREATLPSRKIGGNKPIYELMMLNFESQA